MTNYDDDEWYGMTLRSRLGRVVEDSTVYGRGRPGWGVVFSLANAAVTAHERGVTAFKTLTGRFEGLEKDYVKVHGDWTSALGDARAARDHMHDADDKVEEARDHIVRVEEDYRMLRGRFNKLERTRDDRSCELQVELDNAKKNLAVSQDSLGKEIVEHCKKSIRLAEAEAYSEAMENKCELLFGDPDAPEPQGIMQGEVVEEAPARCHVGDWVRFCDDGVLLMGVVEFVRNNHNVYTTVGVTTMDRILDHR